jgi:hypothetical protein
MNMFWPFLIGVVVAAGLTLLSIVLEFKVGSKEWWDEREQERAALSSSLHTAVAENAQLWVAVAAAEMTEDSKKVAATAVATVDAAIAAAK